MINRILLEECRSVHESPFTYMKVINGRIVQAN